MSAKETHQDLERAIYWQRRRVDAVRLVPVLGTFLFLLPLMFGDGDGAGGSTARIGLYLFAVWVGLVAVSAWLSRRIDPAPTDRGDGRSDGRGDHRGDNRGEDGR